MSRILFIARHFTYFRNFDSVIEQLAERGHDVHLAADREEALGGRELVDRIAARHSNVDVGFTPIRQWGRYRRVSGALRLALDYLRYTDPRYEETPRIRERAYDRTPLFALLLSRLPGRRFVTFCLETLEAAVPRQQGVDEFVAECRPDVLLITPLIELGSPQLDYIRAARRLGVPTALCVWSWDHLSSKALIRVVPDAVIVWNEIQRQEASRFHGIPPDRVIVTGAQCFDRWFDRAPTQDRETFCRSLGLNPDLPFLLYVCSALFKGSPSEAAFVTQWVAALRRSPDRSIREAGILVRPHPQRLEEWREVNVHMPNVAVWGSNPVDDASRAAYYDSMFHSAAVIGLNTSALVEAAVVGRPVLTLLLREFEENQEGTFHFRHLLEVGDGCLETARSLDEHVSQVSDVLAGRGERSNRWFVEQFVRPQGLAHPATPRFVEAVEALAKGPVRQPQRAPVWVLGLRPVVWALELTARTPWLQRLYWNPVKLEEWRRYTQATRDKDAQRRLKRRDKAARVAHKVREQVVVRTKTAVKHALVTTGLMKQS